MALRIKCININCSDPYSLAEFWSMVTGFAQDPDNPNAPGDPEGLLLSPDDSPDLLFTAVDDPAGTGNRLHLDVTPVDRTRDDEIDRLIASGAVQVADRRRPDGSGWVVLCDPEGNRFCVERSAAERR